MKERRLKKKAKRKQTRLHHGSNIDRIEAQKSRRKQEENRKWKHRATKGSKNQAGKESRK